MVDPNSTSADVSLAYILKAFVLNCTTGRTQSNTRARLNRKEFINVLCNSMGWTCERQEMRLHKGQRNKQTISEIHAPK